MVQELQPETRDRFAAFATNNLTRSEAQTLPFGGTYIEQCFARVARAVGKVLPALTMSKMRSDADATRGGPSHCGMGGLAIRDLIELRGLVTRLERSERDLRTRLAKRETELDTPDGSPRSDPLYQRLFFALARLRGQLASANEELSRNTMQRRGPLRESVG